jgi:hypothetical protein
VTERRVVSLLFLALIGSCAGVALAGALAHALELAPVVPALAGSAGGGLVACVLLRERVARRLPAELDGWFARRRKLRWLFLVGAVLAVANTARVGVFVADSAQHWASAFPIVPESAVHQCLAAYVRAGELAAADHANLWRAADYEQAPTTIHGMAEYLGDPYEYPPTFAVLARAAVALTDNYDVIRALWFGISAVGFWLAYLVLAAWAGGRAGATALLLGPPLALSFPLLFGLQWGQAHVVVVAASVAAMVAFARGRSTVGGVLLAVAIATKIFPGLLLVHLAMRRQWRAIAATLIALAALIALATLALGPATLAAFVAEHVPAMASGEAFAYTENNPDNSSLYGLAFKLRTLGVADADRGVASLLVWIWGFVALALAVLTSRGGGDRARDAVIWLAIICLATLRSPFAPAYTAIGTLWLLAVGVGAAPPRRWLAAVVVVCWLVLQGAPPMGSPEASVIASLPAQLVTIAVAVIAAWPRRPS